MTRDLFRTAIEAGIEFEGLEGTPFASKLRELAETATSIGCGFASGCPAAQVGLYKPRRGTRWRAGIRFAEAYDDALIAGGVDFLTHRTRLEIT